MSNNQNQIIMAKNSNIQWTNSTWNPWHGCRKVSEGCKFCYMYRDKERYRQNPKIVKIAQEPNFSKPLQWKEPKLIFTCSWSDWFIEDADMVREAAWNIIRHTPQHTYLILTKRPERIKECLPADWGEGWENVWLGVSVENQAMADIRIPILIDTPAKYRFLSMEPLLEFVNFEMIPSLDFFEIEKMDWIIVGGESGNEKGKYQYRNCHLTWIEDLYYQCVRNRVPFFLKQTGTTISKRLGLKDRHGGDFDELLKIQNLIPVYWKCITRQIPEPLQKYFPL